MKKFIKAIAAILISACTCLAFSACADKDSDNVSHETETMSLITKLDLTVSFNEDIAAAKVKNAFTLFPATATVYVYLYYSESYTADYTKMTEIASNFTEDLDIGKTLTASYDTKGAGGYFIGRMRYKIDSREWDEKVTGVYERDYTKAVLIPIEDDGSLPVFKDIEPVCPHLPLAESYEELYSQTVLAVGYADENMVFVSQGTTLKEFENQNIKEIIQSFGKEFYIFKPVNIRYISSASYISYSLYRNKNDYIFKKSIQLVVPEFGFPAPPELPPPTGFGGWNIKFDLEFVNVNESYPTGKLNIKFGKCEKAFDTDYDKFINLYVGDSCIGTCYYETDTIDEVTYAFFYNLFAEGLSIIK